MSPVKRNIPLYSSADFSESYVMLQKTSRQPISFVGCTGKAEIRLNAGDTNPIATFTVSFPDAVNGKVRIELARSVIQGLVIAGHKQAVWSLNIIDAADRSTMYLIGQANIFTSPTRVP